MKKNLPLIREKFTSNLFYKIVALFVATAIWITTLHGRKDFTIVKNLELQFQHDERFLVETSEELSVKVKVSGSRMTLSKLVGENLSTVVNLVGLRPGRHDVDIRLSEQLLPPGVKLVQIMPRKIEVKLKEVKSHEQRTKN